MTEREVFGIIILLLVIAVVITFVIDTAKEGKNKIIKRNNKYDDRNIEWYGPDVCLKKKNYPNKLEDDFRQNTGEATRVTEGDINESNINSQENKFRHI